VLLADTFLLILEGLDEIFSAILRDALTGLYRYEGTEVIVGIDFMINCLYTLEMFVQTNFPTVAFVHFTY